MLHCLGHVNPCKQGICSSLPYAMANAGSRDLPGSLSPGQHGPCKEGPAMQHMTMKLVWHCMHNLMLSFGWHPWWALQCNHCIISQLINQRSARHSEQTASASLGQPLCWHLSAMAANRLWCGLNKAGWEASIIHQCSGCHMSSCWIAWHPNQVAMLQHQCSNQDMQRTSMRLQSNVSPRF